MTASMFGCSQCGATVKAKGLCAKHYRKAWHEANRAEQVAKMAAYYAGNKDKWAYAPAATEVERKKRNRKTRLWRAANLQLAREHQRRYRFLNPGLIAAAAARDRLENPAKFKARAQDYYSRNLEAERLRSRHKAARRRGAEGTYTKRDVDLLYHQQSGRCGFCLVDLFQKFHIDHVIPLALGGTNWPGNLQLLCPRCNLKKGAKPPSMFRKPQPAP